MSNADWSIAVSILVFLIAIVIAAIYYYRYRKFYLVLYIASVATYISSIFYTWDVFELNKNAVLVMLLVSTIVMWFLGGHFSKMNLKPSKVHTSLKEKNKK